MRASVAAAAAAAESEPRVLPTSPERAVDEAERVKKAEEEVVDDKEASLRISSQLDDRLCKRLLNGDIRLVRSSWLCQPSVERILRRQDLEELERKGESPLLSPQEAVELVRKRNRGMGALT